MKKILAFILCGGLALFLGYRLLAPSVEIRNTNPSGENIIAFGDSLTAGIGAESGMAERFYEAIKIYIGG